jgi:hypothetical protein
MTAPFADFDSIFQQETINKAKKEIRFSTRGTIVDEKIKKAP